MMAIRRKRSSDYAKTERGRKNRRERERREYTRRKMLLAALEEARETGVSRHDILKRWGMEIGRAKNIGHGQGAIG
jgi:transposase